MPNPLSTLGKIATGIIGFHAAILEAITQPFRSTKRNDDNSNAGNTNDKVKIISGSQLALATPFLKINSRVGVALIVVRCVVSFGLCGDLGMQRFECGINSSDA